MYSAGVIPVALLNCFVKYDASENPSSSAILPMGIFSYFKKNIIKGMVIKVEKRSWKILYSDYSGMEKKAVELLSTEMGKIINRDKGVYTLHVLPCEKLGAKADKNAVMIGKYADSDIIRNLVSGSEIPKNGYLIKVVDNPENSDYKIVVITAHTDRNLFYGAVDFVDDCLIKLAPIAGGLKTPCEVFDKKLADFEYSSAPTRRNKEYFHLGTPDKRLQTIYCQYCKT